MRRRLITWLVVLILVPAIASGADVVINEFMAANATYLADTNGVYSDWVELYNRSTNDINLAGWRLRDSANEWVFPATNIMSDGYVLVFASGNPTSVISGELHADFKLSSGGEYLGLVHSNGLIVVHEYFPTFPGQIGDQSYGIGATNELRFFPVPTPGATNTAGFVQLDQPVFDHGRGFYTNEFDLVLTSSMTGSVIRYTTDGSTPSSTFGDVYTIPIALDQTVCIRAIAYKAGDYSDSFVATHTYIFPEDVIVQSPDALPPGPGWPAHEAVNLQAMEYGMDPVIVSDSRYTNRFAESLMSIPTVSLVTDLCNLFGETNGIYVNAFGRGQDWEKPCSIELINDVFNTNGGFQINGGLRIRGGSSRLPRNPKHAFRLFFRSDYGTPKLKYPLFQDEGADEFAKVDLRSEQDHGWGYGEVTKSDTLAREVFSRYIQKDMGQDFSRSRKVHVFINGQYWGVYETEERPGANYGASYHGGSPSDYDTVKPSRVVPSMIATDGNMIAFSNLWDAATTGFADDGRYMQIQGLNLDGTRNPSATNLVDVPNLIDYMMTIHYIGHKDAPISSGGTSVNNLFCLYNREKPDGFKYFAHDCEHVLEVGDSGRAMKTSTVGQSYNYFNPQWLHQQLRVNEEFQVQWMDRIYMHFFHDGALTTNKTIANFKRWTDMVDSAVICESARWGNYAMKGDVVHRTRDDHWWPVVSNLLYGTSPVSLPTRTGQVLGQYKGMGWFPIFEGPVLSQWGGEITNGSSLYITGLTNIYYLFDGRDPREAFTASNLGIKYTNGITLARTTLVKARTFGFSGAGTNFGPLAQAVFTLDTPSSLRISEVMYHPVRASVAETNMGYRTGDFEFIELVNDGPVTIGLAGLELIDGVEFDFTGCGVDTLAPGEYAVIVSDRYAFTNRYGTGITIAGEYRGSLDDGGERIKIVDGLGRTNALFIYGDGAGWPLAADGAGHSLVPLVMTNQATRSLDNGVNWRASANLGGSPGAVDVLLPTDIVLNEITAHTDYTNDTPPYNEYDSNDWIEMFNFAASPVSMDHWYLSDDPDELDKWRIPTTNTIAAGGWLTFDEVNGFHSPITNGFGLNKAGEQVYLSYLPGDGNDRVADCRKFNGQLNGMSCGRYPDGATNWYELMPTTNAANAMPVTNAVVISEVMYHPAPTAQNPEDNQNDEYVELYNPGDGSVDLWNATGEWRVDGGIDFDIPAGTTLAAKEYLVLVPFSMSDSAALNAFLGSYALTNGQVRMMGPYTGRLSNRGERITLEQPLAPDMPGDPVSWVVVDEVVYFDQLPWPLADGNGKPLQRTRYDVSGNEPANWTALDATPGLPPARVAITSPKDGAGIANPFTAAVIATIDFDQVVGTVHQVEFFENGISASVDIAPPYQYDLTCTTNEGDYECRAELTDDTGVYTSRTIAVVSLGKPEALNYGATAVTDVSATLNGAMLVGGAAQAYICWGGTDGGMVFTNWANYEFVGTVWAGDFSADIAGLDLGWTYYYRCFLSNDYGVGWASTAALFDVTYDTWQHSMQIDIDGYNQTEVLTNFPMLITIGSGITGFDYADFASETGGDLRFGAANGHELRYEIEKWDTNGDSYVWVTMGRLSDPDDYIMAYWGNAVVTNPPANLPGQTAWSDGYDMVLHMNEASGIVVGDSSDNDRYCELYGTNTFLPDGGILSGGLRMHGIEDDVINIHTSNPVQLAPGWTIGAWFKGIGERAATETLCGGSTDQHIQIPPRGMNLGTHAGGSFVGSGYDLEPPAGIWNHIVAVGSGGTTKFYHNGVYVDASPAQSSDMVMHVGNWVDGNKFAEYLDEFRISSRVRSADWIWACWANAVSNTSFCSYRVLSGVGPVDEDDDGMADDWETNFFTSTNAVNGGRTEDWDSDGISNEKEYIAGTDPTDPGEQLDIRITCPIGEVLVRYDTIEAIGAWYTNRTRYYKLEDSTNLPLDLWNPVSGESNVEGDGLVQEYTNSPVGPLRFYRVKARLAP